MDKTTTNSATPQSFYPAGESRLQRERRERYCYYLDTVTHVTDASGNVVNEYSFDVWGRRRDKDDWSYTLNGEPELMAGRGFTGHEWLPWFNMYNMNGRLYDPVVGRFLSPDENVQMPDFSQNFNRYSYALNNPLKYIDPNGEWFVIDDLVSFIGGGLINVLTNLGEIDNFWEGLSYFGAGGVGTWISVQSFGLAVPVGNTITSFGNSLLETNFLTEENNFSFKSIDKDEWKLIGKETVIGFGAGFIGDKAGDKISKAITDKFDITSKFWDKAIHKMAENGIFNSLEEYGKSTWIDRNKMFSKEALGDFGKGLGTGVLTGFSQTYLEENWVRPGLDEFKDFKFVLKLKTSEVGNKIFKNSYNPLFQNNLPLIFPPSNPVTIPLRK